MTARTYCNQHPAQAYYSGLTGLEIHGIEYGIEDYVYCVAGAWGAQSRQTFHRVKVNYTRSGRTFIRVHGYRIPLDECIRMGV